jgi:hypothetical protein
MMATDPFAARLAEMDKAPAEDPFAARLAEMDASPPAAMPKQTGTKFIEPADDEPAPAGPTFNDTVAQMKQARAALGPAVDSSSPLGLAKQAAIETGQGFQAMGRGALAANDFVARSIVHPVDTYGGGKAPAVGREVLRGVNSNIPFANSVVEAAGGPAAESPEDEKKAPGANAFGTVAGLPVGNMVGGIAGKAIEAGAPVVSKAIARVGEAAADRNVDRALEKLEERTFKRTRAGVRQGPVEDALAESPELRKAAGNDKALGTAVDTMKKKAGAELQRIYATHPEVGDIGDAVSRMDQRIAQLNGGTSEDAAVAKHLQTIRDELNDRLGTRDIIKTTDLRAEQTAYQKRGYGKAMPGDEAATARIAANREASKAVGDSVIKHVTGLDYAAAKQVAARDPNALASQLLKANDRINAANKIEASIADRSSRVQPAHGFGAAVKRVAAHSVLPAIVGASHGPAAGLGAAALQEGLHALPGAVRATASVADSALARIAQAVRGGQMPPQVLVSQAIAAGVKASTIDALMLQARAGQPAPAY